MSLVAKEDLSRPVWPSSPSATGWESGVFRKDSLPIPNTKLVAKLEPDWKKNPHVLEQHGPYFHGSGFDSINSDSDTVQKPFSIYLPQDYTELRWTSSSSNRSIKQQHTFISEFGSVSFSSYLSTAP